MKPDWMQPLEGPAVCSICKHPNVYFSMVESYQEDEDCLFFGGLSIRFTHFGSKCYCKDCFEDCGGPDYVKRLGCYPRHP